MCCAKKWAADFLKIEMQLTYNIVFILVVQHNDLLCVNIMK